MRIINSKFFRKVLNSVAALSGQTRAYFKNGSFGMAVYPYLMHPCFRKLVSALMMIVAILSAFGGVFYLFGEHVAILFSERAITAYFHHSTLELFFPIGTIIEEKESTLSTMPQVMRALFDYQSYMFILLYVVGIYRISNKYYWIVGIFLALGFSIGCGLVANITTGHYNEGGLQNLGMVITIILGNLTILVSGLDIPNAKLPEFKKQSLALGTIGLAAILFTLFMPTIFSPMIERLSIYSIMVWEVLAGFAIFKFIRLKPVY